MAETDLTDPAGAGGARREEVLALLRAAPGPLSAGEVAEQMGLHVNTVRFHLDGLVEDGAVARTAERRDTPGRPKVLYSLGPQAPGPRSFALLSEMLAGLVASTPAAAQTVPATGRAWGGHLVQRPAPAERLDAQEATSRLLRVLDAVGFEPGVQHTDGGTEIRLQHCPFREVAERHAEVVCGLHRYLIEGALDEMRAPLALAALTPFVTETTCTATLRERR